MSQVKSSPPVRRWLAEPLSRDVERALDRLAQADDVARIAVLPDVHLASGVCIGTVVATRRLIYPDAVGGDIGCGMAALRFETDADALADERIAARLLRGLAAAVPIVRHPRATALESLPAELGDAPLSDAALDKLKSRDGRVELATLGRGNHFVEMQADEAGSLWLMLHSGSRAMGQAIRAAHMVPISVVPPGVGRLHGRHALSRRLSVRSAVRDRLRSAPGGRSLGLGPTDGLMK
jgi:tRNA-splicing ligase RtcB